MSDLKINNITDRTGDSGPVIAGVSTVTSTGSFTVPVGPTEYRGGRGRGVFGSGATPTATNVIDMIEIATTGNAADFGDDNTAGRQEDVHLSLRLQEVFLLVVMLLQLHHQVLFLQLVILIFLQMGE